MDTTQQPTSTRRVGRRLRTIAIAAVVALLVPVAAWAGHQFTDVPNSNVFHADIDWLADSGVTKGCNPPANTRFCPSNNVTREQMAAFLHRLETEGVFLPGDSTMVPIARFSLDSGGGVSDAEFRAPVTGAPTASWDGQRWVVTVPGQNVNINTRQAICTNVGGTPRHVAVTSVSGNLLVYMDDVDGNPDQGSAKCLLFATA